jgi:hypothetical protein
VQPLDYLPHIELILRTLRITPERLDTRYKIAIDAGLLRVMLQTLAQQLPFSAEFYGATYPELRAAHLAGNIGDLHQHFVHSGYFEGRLGAPPAVDEDFYLESYPDVAEAIARGDVASALDHYVRAGAAEGRIPNPGARAAVERWSPVLRQGSGP